jgi:hypothetical protein
VSQTLAITASTGIASVHIGGCTLHSWAGIGIGEETAKKFCGRVLHQECYAKIVERWRRVKALIIDESTSVFLTLFLPEPYSSGESFIDRWCSI